MFRLIATLIVGLLVAQPTVANESQDRATLTDALNTFLAGASIGDVTAHEVFWADDLVYTSSAGLRTDRAAILASMANAPEPTNPPAMVYTAEDIDIRLYDDVAIVAFTLVGTPSDSDADVMRYLNTGTFLKRDDRWQVVAWQATHKAKTP